MYFGRLKATEQGRDPADRLIKLGESPSFILLINPIVSIGKNLEPRTGLDSHPLGMES